VRSALILLALLVASPVSAGQDGSAPEPPAPPELSVEITSPLGRTGLSGPIRIVARVETTAVALSPVQFYVDGRLVGQDAEGPPYAVEWTDENPFERREIVVQVADADGRTARDTVTLQPRELTESADVSSVLLEPSVLDEKNRSVGGLTPGDFRVFEDGVEQELDMAVPDRVPATYTLLIDTSQSMSRRMAFVRDAARELPDRLRDVDQVIVAPFSLTLGTITGPTQDRDTIAGAIDGIGVGTGTAILDCLAAAARQLDGMPGRHVIVLITDGYDEHSELQFESTLSAVKATSATVYVIGVAGVAGISLKGEDLLERLATETGGRAFFPARSFQLSDVHGLIADDVQLRYLLSYKPTNTRRDGTWREIRVETGDPKHIVRVRNGYFAPAPLPITPQLELTIRDVNRQFVDVALEDLIVLEDGVEQHLEAFQESLAPVSLVLVLDQSGSMKRDAPAVMRAARSFVESLPRHDKLSVMLFADRPEFAHDLTTLRLWSLEAIDKYVADGGTALYDAIIMSLQRLKAVEGRRAVVVLTDGRDENNPGTGPGSVHVYEDVLGALREVDATVFPIALGSNVDRDKLEEIAKLSRGEAYFPQDVSGLPAEYRRILENLRRRYIISYTSTNSAHDGAWREVEIRSKRGGVVIESKGGYFAPDGN
jgi:VWFA-related protein